MAIEWANGVRSHEGAVLAYPVYHSRAGAVDLDHVFAKVYEDGVVADVEVGPGNEGHEPAAIIIVDASDEIRELAQEHLAQNARLQTETEELVGHFTNLIAIRPGDSVEVYKGRKVKRGTCATVRRVVEGEWGPRALLSTDQWTAVSNLRPFRDAAELARILERAAGLKVDLSAFCSRPIDQAVRTYEAA